MELLLLALACLVLAVVLYIEHGKLIRAKAGLEEQSRQAERLGVELTAERQRTDSLVAQYEGLQRAYNQQTIDLRLTEQEREQLKGQLAESKATGQDLSELLEERFKSITTQILQERGETLHQRNEETLKPLREALQQFGEQVQRAYTEESRERHSLQQEIRRLVEQSDRLSTDANKLTQALKGDNKVQGNWGEMILEDLLIKSGLERGRHYLVQASYRDTEGNGNFKPDVVVNYPNGGKMIIDSKVNLVAYMEYVACEDDVLREQYAKKHVEAVKEQIKGLHGKNYNGIVQGAPDFVIMFIPNEPAYHLLMHKAPTLWQEAYDKKVLLMNATNLMATLKLAEELWRGEAQRLNIENIFEVSGKLYDQFCNVLEDMGKVAEHLGKAQGSLESSCKRISGGRENLLRQVEKLRKMGSKTKKTLRDVTAKNALIALDDDDESPNTLE